MTNVIDLWRDDHFDAMHFLPNVPEGHKCRRQHGHTWMVRLWVRGAVDEASGMVVDYYDIERAWLPIHAELDHHPLNSIPGLENPTTENLVRWIWRRLKPVLPLLDCIEIQEGSRSGCRYRGDEGEPK